MRPVSRETVFLLNNLLLTAFTFTVLLGTLFPLVAEAVRGVKVSVGEPFFNQHDAPVCMALLFLMGVGPALPWRVAPRDVVRRELAVPAALAVLVALAVAVLVGGGIYAIVTFAFGTFALAVNLRQFSIGARARMRAHGEAAPVALVRLVAGNRRRYGGYLAHIGAITVAVAVGASSAFKSETEATLRKGETMSLRGHTIRLDELWGRQEPQRFVLGADVTVLRDGAGAGRHGPASQLLPDVGAADPHTRRAQSVVGRPLPESDGRRARRIDGHDPDDRRAARAVDLGGWDDHRARRADYRRALSPARASGRCRSVAGARSPRAGRRRLATARHRRP